MIRTYTMRLKATPTQGAKLETLLAQLCELYNLGLEQRRERYRNYKQPVYMGEQLRDLTELRHNYKGYWSQPRHSQIDCLRRLDTAFANFFRRRKAGMKAGYPRFRSPSRYNVLGVPKAGFELSGGILTIKKFSAFRVKTRAKIRGTPIYVSIRRKGAGKWSAEVSCDIGSPPEKVKVSKAVGADFGVTSLMTLSDGRQIPNPRWKLSGQRDLSKARQRIKYKVEGGKNHAKAKEILRKVHQRIAGRRRSYFAEIARILFSQFDLVAYEKLRIRGLIRGQMAKSIRDAGWATLAAQLASKAEYAGKWAVAVDPRGTTQKCSGCGAEVRKSIAVRMHNCSACGLVVDRDVNAARNILALGVSAVERQEANKPDGRRDAGQGADTKTHKFSARFKAKSN